MNREQGHLAQAGFRKLITVAVLTAVIFSGAFFGVSNTAHASTTATWTSNDDFNRNADTTGTFTGKSSVIISSSGVTLGQGFVKISGSGEYNEEELGSSYGIKADGTLWAWGQNNLGQLGVGDTGIHNSPTQVGSETDWQNVSALAFGAVALKTNGTLWVWGNNMYGELGNGTTDGAAHDSPVQVGTATDWKSIAGGGSDSIRAIQTNGTLWTWGANFHGTLGSGNTTAEYTPTQVGTGTNWKDIFAGGDSSQGFSSMAIQSNGTLWAWGYNANGQLGVGDTAEHDSPVQVGSATNWNTIAIGMNHGLGIQTNGTLWAWGDNTNNELGTGNNTSETSPIQIGVATNWTNITASTNYSLAIQSNGTLWGWGNDQYGAFATGIQGNQYTVPTQLGAGTNWSSVKAFVSTVLATQTNGTLQSWGENVEGQLGQGFAGTPTSLYSPEQVGAATNWASLGGFSAFGVGIQTNGTLWSWGYNDDGQLGQGDTVTRTTPTQVGSGTTWQSASVGGNFVAAIQTNGTLWTWGQNNAGQLGQGDTTQRTSPTQVGSGTTWKSVSAGPDYAVAIQTNGTLWSWGDNENGQLGQGDNTERNSPTQVGVGTTWKSVVTSPNSSGTVFAIQTNNTLWAWGFNNNGQLGQGSEDNNTNHWTPVQVGSATNWTSVSTGINHVLAIQSNGTLWAWGYAYFGQLGQGITNESDVTSPTQVGTGTTWSSAAAGVYFSLAIQTNGTLWAFGINADGQLGQGNTTDLYSPTQVGSGTNWQSAAASSSEDASMAIQTNGTLWGWGDDTFGELGFPNPLYVPNTVVAGSIPTTGTLSGLLVNGGAQEGWGALSWTSIALPVNTTISFAEANSNDGVNFSNYTAPVTESTVGATSGSATLPTSNSQYLEILVMMSSSDATHAPTLTGLSLNYSLAPTTTSSSGGGTYSTPVSSGNSSSGTSSSAYPAPVVPKGGFAMSINNGATSTASPQVTLGFNAGTDVQTVELSNSADFSNATPMPYQSTMAWNLCGTASACPNGTDTIYAKFFTAHDQPSAVISNSIQLAAAATVVTSPAVTISVPPVQSTPSVPSGTLKRNLSTGSHGSDVTLLQEWLASDPSVYPQGEITGYFGALTKKAVEKFQLKYGVATAKNPGYGMVGPLTRAKLNGIY